MVNPWRWSVREALLYSKTAPDRLTIGPTLNVPVREVVSLGSWNNVIVVFIAWASVWDPNKAIDIAERSICRGGRFERFYFTLKPL